MAQPFCFGLWRFNPDTHSLASGATEIALEPKVARLLSYLLAHQDEVLSHERLVTDVWEGRVVSDDAVRRAISCLRQALASDGSDGYIKTVHKRGYLAHFPPPVDNETAKAPVTTPQKKPNTAPTTIRWRLAFFGLVLLALVLLLWQKNVFVSPPPMSLAVLPLANHSPDQVPDHVADGMTDELLNRLAQVPELKVVARTSVFQFKGQSQDIRDISRQLNVTHVIEGSVIAINDHLRLTLQLIDCNSGFPLWAQSFDSNPLNPHDVQEAIVTAVSKALHLKAQSPTTHDHPVDLLAYNEYLHGRVLLAQRVGDNLRQSVAAFDAAIRAAPTFSQAHSGRALALTTSAYWGPWQPITEAIAAGRASAEEALRHDPNNAEAYLVLATTKLQSLQIDSARVDYERALTLAPNQIDVLNYYGDYLRYVGQFRHAETVKRKAIENDPLFFVHPRDLSDILGYQGRYAEALTMAERAVTLGGGRWSQEAVFWAQLRLQRFDNAQNTLAALCPEKINNAASCLSKRAAWLNATNHHDEANAKLSELDSLARTPGGWIESYAARAALYADDFNDFDRATAAMRTALTQHEVWLMWPLLNAPGGAKLPEEMSQLPEWLATWNDPQLKELMRAYRRNLLAFRKGA